jgi:hypothetical protein
MYFSRTAVKVLWFILGGTFASALLLFFQSHSEKSIGELQLERVDPMFRPVAELFTAIEEKDARRIKDLLAHLDPTWLSIDYLTDILGEVDLRRVDLLLYDLEPSNNLRVVLQIEYKAKSRRTVSYELITVESVNGEFRIMDVPRLFWKAPQIASNLSDDAARFKNLK